LSWGKQKRGKVGDEDNRVKKLRARKRNGGGKKEHVSPRWETGRVWERGRNQRNAPREKNGGGGII